MTFTYNLTAPFDDIARVRFHVGDVDQTTAVFSDEEIKFRLSEDGGWQAAVIACLESVIARMAADPNFTAQWLTVNNNSGLQYYTKLLDRKRQEFGIASIVGRSVYTYRPDSNQTSAPTFTDFDLDDDDLDGDNDDE